MLMGFCRQVVWLSDVDRAKGYAVDFLSLSLHAISTDPEAYPSPCIYAQVYMFPHLSMSLV
jgi:nucleotide-sensitive chloride channel 1A